MVLYGIADTYDKGAKAATAAAAAHAPAPDPAAAAPKAASPLSASMPQLTTARLTATYLDHHMASLYGLPPPLHRPELHPPRHHQLQQHCASASSGVERPAPAVPVAAAVLDAALFHAAASLALPGLLINRTVWASSRALALVPARWGLHPRLRAQAPSALGLSLLPLAVHRIDACVEGWIEAYLRPHLRLLLPPGGGATADLAAPSKQPQPQTSAALEN